MKIYIASLLTWDMDNFTEFVIVDIEKVFTVEADAVDYCDDRNAGLLAEGNEPLVVLYDEYEAEVKFCMN